MFGMRIAQAMRMCGVALFAFASIGMAGAGAMNVAAQADSPPTLMLSRVTCDTDGQFPVYMESECEPVDSGSFVVTDGAGATATLDFSGVDGPLVPEHLDLTKLGAWNIDTSAESNPVLACNALDPSTGALMASLEISGGDSFAWDEIVHQSERGTFVPNVECVLFDLPNGPENASAVRFEGTGNPDRPWVAATEAGGDPLPLTLVGERGEDVEIDVQMMNEDTGDRYSFAVDSSGIVLAPSGAYTITEVASGESDTVGLDVGVNAAVSVGGSSEAATTAPAGPSSGASGSNTQAPSDATNTTTATDAPATEVPAAVVEATEAPVEDTAPASTMTWIQFDVQYCMNSAGTCEFFMDSAQIEVSVNGAYFATLSTQQSSIGIYRASVEVPSDAVLTVTLVSPVAEVSGETIEIAVSDIPVGGCGGEATCQVLTLTFYAP